MSEAAARATVTLHTGTEMPVLGLGTWQLDDESAERIRHALELGYPLIDTAVDYYTQSDLGDALRSTAAVSRDEVFLVSKVEEDEDAYAATRERIEEIGTDRLDLCLIHRPPPDGAGESLWQGLIDAKRDGLTREIGVSNYSPDQIDALIETSGETPAVNQIEWSPFGFSEAVLEHARKRGIVIQAYSPLTRAERLDDPTLAEIGAAHGKTPAQVLLRWDLQTGGATVPKAADPDHQRENLELFDFELTAAEMERLGSLNERYSALAGLPYV